MIHAIAKLWLFWAFTLFSVYIVAFRNSVTFLSIFKYNKVTLLQITSKLPTPIYDFGEKDYFHISQWMCFMSVYDLCMALLTGMVLSSRPCTFAVESNWTIWQKGLSLGREQNTLNWKKLSWHPSNLNQRNGAKYHSGQSSIIYVTVVIITFAYQRDVLIHLMHFAYASPFLRTKTHT